MHRQSHRAVAGATEHRAVPNEVAGYRGCELYLCRASILWSLDVDIQLFESKPVSHVFALDDQENRLALLDG